MICPKCGYTRKDEELVPETECPNCGIIYAKYITKRKTDHSAMLQNINNRGLTLAKDIIHDFCLKYPETAPSNNKLRDFIFSTLSLPSDKKIKALEQLQKKIPQLNEIVVFEIQRTKRNTERDKQLNGKIEIAQKAINEGRVNDAQLLLKKLDKEYDSFALAQLKEQLDELVDTNETQEVSDNLIKCPSCGSTSIATLQKGYSAGSGCCGAILLGPIGLLCGAMEGQQVNNICQKCGKKWKI